MRCNRSESIWWTGKLSMGYKELYYWSGYSVGVGRLFYVNSALHGRIIAHSRFGTVCEQVFKNYF